MSNNNLRWYMITTISGKEEKVIESLRNRAVSEVIEDQFDLSTVDKMPKDATTEDNLTNHRYNGFRVFLVPHIAPKELEKKSAGEDFKTKSRNLFKGYIFVKMNMTNIAWFVVRNTQYVTGLVGSSGQRAKPTPISNLEVLKMEKRAAKVTSEFHDGIIKTPFLPGVLVEVTNGPAKGQVGTIIENNDERGIAVVEIILFERKTPTEIPYINLALKK